MGSSEFRKAMQQAKRIPVIKSRRHKRQAIRTLLQTLRSAVGAGDGR